MTATPTAPSVVPGFSRRVFWWLFWWLPDFSASERAALWCTEPYTCRGSLRGSPSTIFQLVCVGDLVLHTSLSVFSVYFNKFLCVASVPERHLRVPFSFRFDFEMD